MECTLTKWCVAWLGVIKLFILGLWHLCDINVKISYLKQMCVEGFKFLFSSGSLSIDPELTQWFHPVPQHYVSNCNPFPQPLGLKASGFSGGVEVNLGASSCELHFKMSVRSCRVSKSKANHWVWANLLGCINLFGPKSLQETVCSRCHIYTNDI